MRHGKKVNHLSRKSAHRKSMLANMACSLIEHKRINTTVAKAKALKVFVEPLVTKSKEDTTHNRRVVFSRLRQKEAVTTLFRDIAVKVGDRPGGYTRIIKLGNRLGDNAEMAMIELVDFNELYNANKPAKKKSTRRGRSKSTETQPVAPAPVEEKVEAAVEETATPVEETVTEVVEQGEETTQEAEEQVTEATEEQSSEGDAENTEEEK
ncbi:MAG TPA: 50S ribosomal protein L17 [Flavobacteriaceae bacterium]|nr:50S ribosomal protein L17 [Flavobacteriaceae bacterium]